MPSEVFRDHCTKIYEGFNQKASRSLVLRNCVVHFPGKGMPKDLNAWDNPLKKNSPGVIRNNNCNNNIVLQIFLIKVKGTQQLKQITQFEISISHLFTFHYVVELRRWLYEQLFQNYPVVALENSYWVYAFPNTHTHTNSHSQAHTHINAFTHTYTHTHRNTEVHTLYYTGNKNAYSSSMLIVLTFSWSKGDKRFRKHTQFQNFIVPPMSADECF